MHLYRYTNNRSVPIYLSWKLGFPVVTFFSFLFHPGSTWFNDQFFVAFTMYADAFAILPQLYLLRCVNEVEAMTSHYVATLVIARLMRLLFWLHLWILDEIFWGLLIPDILHTIMSFDYLWQWYKRLRMGGRLIYSVSDLEKY